MQSQPSSHPFSNILLILNLYIILYFFMMLSRGLKFERVENWCSIAIRRTFPLPLFQSLTIPLPRPQPLVADSSVAALTRGTGLTPQCLPHADNIVKQIGYQFESPNTNLNKIIGLKKTRENNEISLNLIASQRKEQKSTIIQEDSTRYIMVHRDQKS